MVKQIEILFKKIMLVLLLLIKRKPIQQPSPSLNSNSKILFIRLNRIGDALISTPLLKEFKNFFGCKNYVLASKNNYFVFNDPELIDEIIILNKKANSIKNLISKLNSYNFDVIIDLHDDVSTTVSYLLAAIQCEHKIGFKKNNNKLYSFTVPRLDSSKTHVIDRIMEFAKAFGINFNHSDINIHYTIPNSSISHTNDFILKHFETKKYLVGINISAGSDARFWGTQNYKNLISSLSNYDLNMVILCHEKDIDKAFEIASDIYPIYYTPSFEDFCAMIKNLNILFTPDTSIVHIASAFKIPVFGLYVKYNTKDKIWSPYKSPFEYVLTTEPTLENISFWEVKNKFIPFLEKFYYEYKTNTRL